MPGRREAGLLEARRLIADGIDPVDQARLHKIADSIAASDSANLVAAEWLEKVRLAGLPAIFLQI
ncbi:hypothetical protein IP68_03605 [Blastomonas sp. AAP25]|nr:hypothetical protein IP68_03605 [Blastomonas sp. AAP25]